MQVFSRRLFGLLSVLIAAVAIAACGGGDDNSDSGDSGGGSAESAPAGRTGGEATFAYASFPDYLDPALSYTVAGWQALADTNLPLLTYKRVKGEEGATLIPALAEAMPEVTDDGKTYTLTLRDGLKYSDGSPVKANDFEYTIKRVINLESGGSSFYTGNIVGAEEYEKAGKAKGDISGITADDATRKITIKINAAERPVPVHPRDGLRRSRPGRHAVREPDEGTAPGRRSVQDHVGLDRPQLRDGEERELPRDRGSAGCEAGQDHDQRGHAGLARDHRRAAEQGRLLRRAAQRATPCASSASRPRTATAARSRTRPTTTSSTSG